tara:strand:+ start:1962 stop:2327 length:366 start_codon:yes stop_codon:yes gene_type:complete
MKNHSGIIFLIILIYELLNLIRFNHILKKNFFLYKKILILFKYKKVSDDWKKKVILNYSKNLFQNSIKIILVLIIILLLIIIISHLIDDFYIYLLSTPGIIEMSILFFLYYFLRKKINAKL